MTDQEKTPEEIAENLLGHEDEVVQVAIYKFDVEKLKEHSYQAIADALNETFGTLAIDVSDGSEVTMMFLDTKLGKFLTRDDEKVEIL